MAKNQDTFLCFKEIKEMNMSRMDVFWIVM